ncbi:MAG TPA: hypothetical protein VH138_13580 [Vicinamibacterales bacterium]|jgi:hypothetical protein|nr:hypothetical protein [Vicinamibacterales bacterium]
MNQNECDRDQESIAALLRETPAAPVSSNFLARVNERIDETAGWFGLTDFRAWTLGLVPAAVALVLLAILWPVTTVTSPATPTAPAQVTSAQTFTPSSYSDWQQDVTANALLEAALRSRVRTDAR